MLQAENQFLYFFNENFKPAPCIQNATWFVLAPLRSLRDEHRLDELDTLAL